MKNSAKKLAANRRNARSSTGPKTPEGKAASAQNSTTHGLTGAFRCLPHEDPAVFVQLLETYRSEFKPASEHQRFLVGELAHSRCRLDRVRRFEAVALEQMLANEWDETNPDTEIVKAISYRCTNILDLLQRYTTTAERAYYRAHRELMQSRSKEKQNEANDAQVWLKAQIEATPMPDWGISYQPLQAPPPVEALPMDQPAEPNAQT